MASTFKKKAFPTKKGKVASPTHTPMEIVVGLQDDSGQEIPDDFTVENAFRRAKIMTLNGSEIPITVNGPLADRVMLLHPRVGILSWAQVETVNCSPLDCIVEWYHINADGVETCVHSGAFFRPNDTMIGGNIVVKAFHPSLPLHKKSMTTPVPILPYIGTLSSTRMEKISEFNHSRVDDEISVMCYNILADSYARTPKARDCSFPYCPKEALDWTYRRGLLVDELDHMNADIIGLQECSVTVASGVLNIWAREKNYIGVFKSKLGRIREGELLLLRSSRFQFIKDYSVSFKDLFADISDEKTRAIWTTVFPNFYNDDLRHLSTIFQVVLVKDNHTDQFILVANTHLFFHPQASHTRLLQVHILLSYLHHLRHSVDIMSVQVDTLSLPIHIDLSEASIPTRKPCLPTTTLSSSPLPVLVMGDFNTTKCSLAAAYLRNGRSPPASTWHTNYNCQHTFAKTKDADEIASSTNSDKGDRRGSDNRSSELQARLCYDVDVPTSVLKVDLAESFLENPMKSLQMDVYAEFQNTLLDSDEHLVWSNRVTGFCEQLDYIGVSADFEVKSLLGCPQNGSDLDSPEYDGIPTPFYPSDHIAIGCKLVMKKLTGDEEVL
eukprot:GHVH01013394.1.p1 GENE.GHVH01013394.1~~GHVH01013394.1.p1  ORF type:complete len:682 (+),score=86.31 GHVH01013394.1:222-2048(+)